MNLIQFILRWFCHFDDDQYVNIKMLYDTLLQYDSNEDYYLGRSSIEKEIEIKEQNSHQRDEVTYFEKYLFILSLVFQKSVKFWFATGGAGFCLSHHLFKKIQSFIENGEFVKESEKMGMPDDVTIGYIIEKNTHVSLTNVRLFHSHLEPLNLLKNLSSQISLSYYIGKNYSNIIQINGINENQDPTRFLSLHNYLYEEKTS